MTVAAALHNTNYEDFPTPGIKKAFDHTKAKLHNIGQALSAKMAEDDMADKLKDLMAKIAAAVLYAVRYIWASIRNLFGFRQSDDIADKALGDKAVPGQAFVGNEPGSGDMPPLAQPVAWELDSNGEAAGSTISQPAPRLTLEGEDLVREVMAPLMLGKPTYLLPSSEEKVTELAEKSVKSLLLSVDRNFESPKVARLLLEWSNGKKDPQDLIDAVMVPALADARQNMRGIESRLFDHLNSVMAAHIPDAKLRMAAISEVIFGLPAVTLHSSIKPEVLQHMVSALIDKGVDIEHLVSMRAQVSSAPEIVSSVSETMSDEEIAIERPGAPVLKRGFAFPGGREKPDAQDIDHKEVHSSQPRPRG